MGHNRPFHVGRPQEVAARLPHREGVPIRRPWYLSRCLHSPVVGGWMVAAPAGDKVRCSPALAGQPPIYNRPAWGEVSGRGQPAQDSHTCSGPGRDTFVDRDGGPTPG